VDVLINGQVVDDVTVSWQDECCSVVLAGPSWPANFSYGWTWEGRQALLTLALASDDFGTNIV